LSGNRKLIEIKARWQGLPEGEPLSDRGNKAKFGGLLALNNLMICLYSLDLYPSDCNVSAPWK